jgi:hypothetical protein
MPIVPRFASLLASASVALIVASLSAAPVNALAVENHNVRHVSPRHDALAKAKRSTPKRKRCKPAQKPITTSSTPADNGTNNAAPAPADKPAGNNGNNNGGGGGNNNSSPPPSSGNPNVIPPSNGGGKAGLAWANGPWQPIESWAVGSVSWYYTWSPVPVETAPGNLEFVPMLWGWNQIDLWNEWVLGGKAQFWEVLGMNEPNQQGQSDMSAGSGVELWKTYIQPLKSRGVRLISPATTSSPTGKQWIQEFQSICGGACTFDAVSLHWYDVGVQKFIDYVTDFHNTFNSNIWVTEYACQNFNGGAQCSEGEIWDFLQQTTGWMDATPWVEKYAWFGVMKDMQGVNDFDRLMGDDGRPNALGQAYIS